MGVSTLWANLFFQRLENYSYVTFLKREGRTDRVIMAAKPAFRGRKSVFLEPYLECGLLNQRRKDPFKPCFFPKRIAGQKSSREEKWDVAGG